MNTINIKTIVLTGILAALVFVVTSFTMIRVPFVYIREAYFHAGDSMIYMSALMLGGPVAALVSGIGSFLADLYLGAPQYMFATLIIKGIMGLIAGYFLYTAKGDTALARKITGLVLAGLWMALGYYLYEVLVLAIDPIVNLPNLLANLTQAAVGIIIFLPLSRTVERLKGRIYP